MIDRYTKIVLTVIAGALIYQCIVMTVFPAVQAQTQRPGEFTGKPVETVIVGWRGTEPVPVTAPRPLQTVATDTVHITGTVQTGRASGLADRVVIVGWESGATRDRSTRTIPLSDTTAGLPVRMLNR